MQGRGLRWSASGRDWSDERRSFTAQIDPRDCLICWLTAPGVTWSSAAALAKLRCRAATTKARRRTREGKRLRDIPISFPVKYKLITRTIRIYQGAAFLNTTHRRTGLSASSCPHLLADGLIHRTWICGNLRKQLAPHHQTLKRLDLRVAPSRNGSRRCIRPRPSLRLSRARRPRATSAIVVAAHRNQRPRGPAWAFHRKQDQPADRR